ncbi:MULTISPECIES: CoA-acylating methylmalonate-semialdehyde dehydrogenase [Cryobacterium]|uniref:methylmalonate-semialdehyde dehydrogenase (CoA acylating) n=1 Tax=Cryobacterium gelidum TaxID=1259164 RepID=A0A4R9AW66_9MICO|nr:MULTISPECIES: CoA-acylating methylmalonate-semialdehyde dehydrogenase [Cryobacterium]TFB70895.1 CoA-acylating methylmalonate-semialdehyde dehydrogenase [Cryobacterium sp. Hz9]TFD70888.1 CoA-acylating methylmalonate-semialdehyde dehydrogenase [Cryobacterium gelidum]
MTDLPTIQHYVNGVASAGTSTRTAPVYNPATGTVAKNVLLASTADLDAAVAVAQAAYPAWRDTSQARRQSIMYNFRELLNARKGDLAEILTAEHGKVISDALGEIIRGLEVVEFALGMPHLSKGEYSENVSTGVDVYTLRQPLGVVGIISPFNFPAMVPLWYFPIAIAAGNTVVLKPSEKDPSASNWLAELFTEAGLPEGVLNVVHGDKEAVDALLVHPDVQAISFVGSTPIARYIYETAARHGKRVQSLGGAKNHMLVLPDADLDLTADAAVNAGFGSAGERCMAISVIVAVEPVADELIAKIAQRVKGLTVGDGTRGCDMGPLITKVHRDKVAGYIDIAQNDGAEIVIDGRDISVDGDPNGFWLGPTLFDKVSVDSAVYLDEIFGPVLSIVRVATYQEGLDLINASQYGNGTAIFTNDGGAARRFQNEVQVGMVGINVPIPVPVAYHSFGGWKNSLFGDAKAYGPAGVNFYTREKAVTSRWLDPSHGGINLGFPQNQ